MLYVSTFPVLLHTMVCLTQLSFTVSHTYFVKPDGSNCTEKLTDATCKTLQEYTRCAFSDNSILQFLQGEHRLSSLLNLTGLTNVSLMGASLERNSVIQCSGEYSGVSIINSTDLSIAYLTLKDCGTEDTSAALFYENVADITVNGVSVIESKGFGIRADNCCGLISINRSVFSDNKRQQNYGGGNARFLLGRCDHFNASLTIGKSEFINGESSSSDREASGITIMASTPDVRIELNSVILKGNMGGNLMLKMEDFVDSHWQIFIDNCLIEQGHSYIGGGGVFFMSRWHDDSYKECVSTDGNVLQISNTNFTRNMAEKYGGALMIRLFVSDCMPSKISLIECQFDVNTIDKHWGHGSAIGVVKSTLPDFYQQKSTSRFPLHDFGIVRSHFFNNYVSGNQASVVDLASMKKVTVTNSSFCNNYGTAISLRASTMIFTGRVLFQNNTAMDGGALRFCESSVMFFNNKTTLHFLENRAMSTGGAIFVQESCLDRASACFFQPNLVHRPKEGVLVSDISHIKLLFTNNTAATAGNSVYGGRIDHCFTYMKLTKSNVTSYFHSTEVFKMMTNFTPYDQYRDVSSDPFRVLFCDPEGKPLLDNEFNEPLRIVPGKTFRISVVATGQHHGIAPATITADLDPDSSDNTSLHMEPFIPSRKCSSLTMHIQTNQPPGHALSLIIKVQLSGSFKARNKNHDKIVPIVIEPCPWGFTLMCSEQICECTCSLDEVDCNLGKSTIQRKRLVHNLPIWVGCSRTAIFENDTKSCEKKDFLYAYGCGHDGYCHIIANFETSADSVDDQCSEGRTGILCASCAKGLSVVLGTGQCKKCPRSNMYLFLVPVYLAAGILLVVVLTKFKLTITSGSMYGLIFYANFVHWNRFYFFPYSRNYDILRLVIAWLNLDLGIEVCFFDGMNNYQLIWLQIGYILYILFLQLSIILLCRKYVVFTRFFGRNVTKVMSTILILLFQKVLGTVVDVFQYTRVHSSTSHSSYKVLSVDGNIRYLSHKHIPLMVVATPLGVFLVLFTFSLLFIQLLIRISSVRCFKWVVRLQPFFETITGPCNEYYLFWPGFMFLARLVVYVSHFAFQAYGHHQLYITSGLASLLLMLSFIGPRGVYKKWSLNVLELTFLFNLTIICLICARPTIKPSTTNTWSHVSVGLALVIFVLYHNVVRTSVLIRKIFLLIIKNTILLLKGLKDVLSRKKANTVTCTEVIVSPSDERTPLLPAKIQVMPPVANYGKLREPLLDNVSK